MKIFVYILWKAGACNSKGI